MSAWTGTSASAIAAIPCSSARPPSARSGTRTPSTRTTTPCPSPRSSPWSAGSSPASPSFTETDMSLEHWLAFTLASAILVAIPGPTVLLVISYALGHGRKSATATVAGVALGDFTAMTASMLGLGAFLAASATLFTALKLIGAAYLIYMGIRLWRAPVAMPGIDAPTETDGRRIFAHAYVVTALNPKSIVFFI